MQGDVGRDAKSIVASGRSVHLGGLDVLVNNAGWGRRMSLEELDPEVYEQMWRTNVLGAALMAQPLAPPPAPDAGGGSDRQHGLDRGSKKRLRGRFSAYSSTKFALTALTQCWQAELRPDDIRVIQINPSEVQTGFGGKDPDRAMNAHKLHSEDVAHAIVAALEMEDRGFVPELTIHATNPWKGD